MVTGSARVSDLAVAKVRGFCDQRDPAEARDEVRLEVTTWADRNRRWRRYDHFDPTPHQLDDLLKEIDEDRSGWRSAFGSPWCS